jgi:hypothetical protein
MADPVWVDGVTPVNAVNMTKLQTRDEKDMPSGYVGIDPSSNIFAPARINWGPAIASAPDVALWRTKPGELTMVSDPSTSNSFNINSLYPIGATGSTIGLSVNNYPWIFMKSPDASGGAGIEFTSKGVGSDGDWMIYTQLASFPGMRFAGGAGAPDMYQFSAGEFDLLNNQAIKWSPAGGGAADTFLQRWYVGSLFTPGGFGLAGNVRVYHSAVAAALTTELNSDTTTRFAIDTNGSLQWGPGNAALDTLLQRNGVNQLKTNGGFFAGNMGVAGRGATANASYAFTAWMGADAEDYFELMVDGSMKWGPGGAVAADVTLYRSAPSVINIDDLSGGGGVYSFDTSGGGGYPSFYISAPKGGAPGDTGAWLDLNAGNGASHWSLWTENDLDGIQFWNQTVGWAGTFSSTELGFFKTDHDAQYSFKIGKADGKLSWGVGGATAPDTTLYRSAVGQLKTDGNLVIGGLGGSSQLVQVGAADSGGAGYRMLRVPN